MLELIYAEKIIKFYSDLIAGSKGLTVSHLRIENASKTLPLRDSISKHLISKNFSLQYLCL